MPSTRSTCVCICKSWGALQIQQVKFSYYYRPSIIRLESNNLPSVGDDLSGTEEKQRNP